jgi:hypothetical protein
MRWRSPDPGRSIVETLPGQQNGYQVATDWYSAGYRGCWVIALGTNDAADVAAGSNVGMQPELPRSWRRCTASRACG